jgi:hypothetical protein
MFKKMLSTIFVVMLSGAALLSVSVQAQPMLVQDFWGTKADGTTELFATLKVDVLDAVEWSGNTFEAKSWSSFTVFGQEILPLNTFLFEAQFDMSNLFAGLTYFNFDVKEELSNISFSGFYESAFDVSFYSVLDGQYSEIYTDGAFATPTSVVPAPASILLILVGFAALARRRVR